MCTERLPRQRDGVAAAARRGEESAYFHHPALGAGGIRNDRNSLFVCLASRKYFWNSNEEPVFIITVLSLSVSFYNPLFHISQAAFSKYLCLLGACRIQPTTEGRETGRGGEGRGGGTGFSTRGKASSHPSPPFPTHCARLFSLKALRPPV